MTQYSDWIPWNGTRQSRCPVPHGTMGQLQFRCEPDDLEWGPLPYDISIYRWDDTGRKEDIIAYRVLTPAISED
jgi:hypothetical protein